MPLNQQPPMTTPQTATPQTATPQTATPQGQSRQTQQDSPLVILLLAAILFVSIWHNREHSDAMNVRIPARAPGY